jgi:hypothetical protein
MEEALTSFNVKFKMHGFDCCLTLRSDKEGLGVQITQAEAAVGIIRAIPGVTPMVNQHAGAAPVAARPPVNKPLTPQFQKQLVKIARSPVPVCPSCGQSDEVELISFNKNGKPRQAFKCQACQSWLPDQKI